MVEIIISIVGGSISIISFIIGIIWSWRYNKWLKEQEKLKASKCPYEIEKE